MSVPFRPAIAKWSVRRSPFACIGLADAPDADGWDKEMLGKMVRAAKPFPAGNGKALLRWLDASGAGMGFHYASGDFQCYKPWFAAGRNYRLLPKSWIADPVCRFCDRLMADLLTPSGDAARRLALEIENLELVREQVVMNLPVSCEIAAFAQTICCGENEPQPDTSTESDFGDVANAAGASAADLYGITPAQNRSESEARITGRVAECERRVNALTGGAFVHFVLDTGPLPFEIVSADLPQLPTPGAVVQAECWLIAKIRESETSQPHAVICLDC